MDKTELRALLFKERSKITCRDKKDNAICEAVLKILKSIGAQRIFSYVSMGTEVDTKKLICKLQTNYKVFVPFTSPENSRMQLIPLRTTDKLSTDNRGNLIDYHAPYYQGPIDVALVPLLGYNRKLFRIGYGGGYYDRYLVGSSALKLGLAYAEQFMEFLPDSYDIPLDAIVTPTGIVRRKNG